MVQSAADLCPSHQFHSHDHLKNICNFHEPYSVLCNRGCCKLRGVKIEIDKTDCAASLVRSVCPTAVLKSALRGQSRADFRLQIARPFSTPIPARFCRAEIIST